MIVDSHVNLHNEQFGDDLDDVVTRAHAAGVGVMLNICCNLKDAGATLAIAEAYEHMYASVGTHPHDAKDNPDIKPSDIIALTDNDKVIGVGETGLDFHYNYSERDVQIRNFEAHIEAARQTGLPLIVHTREADALMADMLESEMKNGEFPLLLHCYSSGPDLAKRADRIGAYFALSGIITFKNAHDVRAIAKTLPDERIMLETDCPYLAPVPHRGRRCEPAFVAQVCEELARIKGWSVDETARRTTDAFFDLFRSAKRPV